MATNNELLGLAKTRRLLLRQAIKVKKTDPSQYEELKQQARSLLTEMQFYGIEDPAAYAIEIIGT
jgi:hypothetical protein